VSRALLMEKFKIEGVEIMKKDDYLNVESFVGIHNNYLERKTEDVHYKKEKLKRVLERGPAPNRSLKSIKLISVYSLMIIMFINSS
jgi:hypothetical protein